MKHPKQCPLIMQMSTGQGAWSGPDQGGTYIFNVIFNISVEDLHTLFTNAINTRKFEAITHKKRKQKEKNERKAKCFLLLLLWRNNLTSNCAPRVGWLTARRPKKRA